jgi:hypothetical protein
LNLIWIFSSRWRKKAGFRIFRLGPILWFFKYFHQKIAKNSVFDSKQS